MEQNGMIENDIWLECLGKRGYKIVAEWNGPGNRNIWNRWTNLARGCFELANNKTDFVRKRQHPKCNRTHVSGKQILRDVYKGDQRGFQCQKS